MDDNNLFENDINKSNTSNETIHNLSESKQNDTNESKFFENNEEDIYSNNLFDNVDDSNEYLDNNDEKFYEVERNEKKYNEDKNYQVYEFEQAPKKKKGKFKKAVALILAFSILSAGFYNIGYRFGISSQSKNQNSVKKLENANNGIDSNNEKNLVLTTSTNQNILSAKDVFKEISNAVVSISTKSRQNSNSIYNYYQEYEGAGSGIIIHENEEKLYIVTNAHVINGANEVYISLDDNVQIPADKVGKDVQNDIAVISVSKDNLKLAEVTNYKIAFFADSSKLEVGEDVMAIGNSAGEGKSATKGIISAIDKEINVEGTVLEVVQTDAAINPGNSGGALVNMSAEIVGINTAKYSGTSSVFSLNGNGSIEGMGYSIPSNKVKLLVEQLITDGFTTTEENLRPYIGIKGGTISSNDQLNGNYPNGVFVQSVVLGSNAEKAGLRAGDIIVSLNDTPVESIEKLTEVLISNEVGAKATLEVFRNGKTYVFSFILQDMNSINNF